MPGSRSLYGLLDFDTKYMLGKQGQNGIISVLINGF